MINKKKTRFSPKQEEVHLRETTLKKDQVYHGNMLKVWQDHVHLPDGSEGIREFVEHPGAATILPFVSSHELVMVKQFRYPLGKVFLELPAGKLSPGELALATAQRELEEETGYRAKVWEAVGQAHPCVGYADEVIYYFKAHALSFHQPCPDEGEWVEPIIMKVACVLDAIRDGDITDSKTITGMMLALQKGMLKV